MNTGKRTAAEREAMEKELLRVFSKLDPETQKAVLATAKANAGKPLKEFEAAFNELRASIERERRSPRESATAV